MKNKENKYTPEKWMKLTRIIILDPDGWDRTYENFEKDWNIKLTYDDFITKAGTSTVMNLGMFLVDPEIRELYEYLMKFGKNLKLKNDDLWGDIDGYTFECYPFKPGYFVYLNSENILITIDNIEQLFGAIKILNANVK